MAEDLVPAANVPNQGVSTCVVQLDRSVDVSVIVTIVLIDEVEMAADVIVYVTVEVTVISEPLGRARMTVAETSTAATRMEEATMGKSLLRFSGDPMLQEPEMRKKAAAINTFVRVFLLH